MENNERIILELCSEIKDKEIRANVIDYLSNEVDDFFFIS